MHNWSVFNLQYCGLVGVLLYVVQVAQSVYVLSQPPLWLLIEEATVQHPSGTSGCGLGATDCAVIRAPHRRPPPLWPG